MHSCSAALGTDLRAAAPPGISLVALDVDTVDITDRAQVDASLNRVRPDGVLNCAAFTAVDRAELEAAAA